MMHCFGERSGNSGETNFADAASTQFVDLRVRIIEEMYVNGGRVGVHRHQVVGQAAIDGSAVLRVVGRVLEESHANTHHDCALDLVPAGQRVYDPPPVYHRHHSATADPLYSAFSAHLLTY